MSHLFRGVRLLLILLLVAACADIRVTAQTATPPASTNFGAVSVNSSSPPVATLTFTFTAGGKISLPSVLTQGAAGLDFSDAGTGTCTTNGTSHLYATNDTCTVDVKFKPLYPGARNGAALLFNANHALIATAYVYGKGAGPQMIFRSNQMSTVLAHMPFSTATGLAVDGSGNIFISQGQPANNPTNKVEEFTAASNYATTITLAGFFNNPQNIALDGAGNIFVADQGQNLVKEIVAAGGYTKVKTIGPGFNRPQGIAVDGSGNVFVTTYGDDLVQEVLADGNYSTVNILGSGFSDPSGVAVDTSGNVFVADNSNTPNGEVKEILATGGYTTVKTLGSGFRYPMGVALDTNANVFVTSVGEVQEIVAADDYNTVKTLYPATIRYAPAGPALDPRGNIYFNDVDSLLNPVVSVLDFSDPPTLNFATTGEGQTSTDSPQVVTVENSGNRNLTFSDVAYPADFPEATGHAADCTSSTPLAAGVTCTLSINFSPLDSSLSGTSTDLSEMVSVTDSKGGHSVAVKGTVIPAPPVLTSPAPGSTLGGSSVVFTWNPGDATIFKFWVGKSVGTNNIYGSGQTNKTSASVNNLPTNGVTVYVRLFYMANGTWKWIDYTYIEAGTPVLPSLTSPTPESNITSSSATFTWNPGTETLFKFWLGYSFGKNNIYGSGETTQTSATVFNLPTNGTPIFARLFYRLNGTWYSIDYTYNPKTPAMITPSPGSTLAGSQILFKWYRGSAISFKLWVGKSVGSNSIYGSGETTAAQITVSNLPTDGSTVYVRLNYLKDNTWSFIDYTYTAQ